jgi:hypothetical protein
MTKAEIEKQMTDLTNRFWVELTMRNFDQVDLISKKMKRLEALMRIEEDEEEVKSNPAIPESEMLTFLKKLKRN